MTARAQLHRASSPMRWWPTLLVLGVLAGVLGMHGLAPGGAALTGHHSSHHSSSAAHLDMAALSAESVCHSNGDGSGHAQHADPTCASGAVGAGPTLPVLAPDPVGREAGASVGSHQSPAAKPDGGRAPPSLAELQLLRI
ncbi:hypothetical protein STRIP9103_07490 [Streptomyces ipomoeae 91-03]|uniref:Uncharacterized protein n=1 Tax=Streptomyces ipomoeae 91-03 TaxID=698759 RepID=L1L727_9ACTN|nr:hypothetical protein STRIP9103_07490 [Streptomyces ipomoeae 91-03]